MTDADKKADLAGPGLTTYEEVAKSLSADYRSVLTPMETMEAVFAIKVYMESHLCRELNLKMVQVPLIVTRESGINDLLDREEAAVAPPARPGLGGKTRRAFLSRGRDAGESLAPGLTGPPGRNSWRQEPQDFAARGSPG